MTRTSPKEFCLGKAKQSNLKPLLFCRCSSCIRDHRDDGDDDNSQEDYTDRQNDGDDDDYRKRARRLARRDLLGNLLNIHNDLCLVNGGKHQVRSFVKKCYKLIGDMLVVSTATSIVGDVTSLAVSVVTDILDGTTTTRTTSSSRSSSDDDEGKYDRPTATVTAYATETVRSAAGRKVTGCKGMVTAIVAAVGLLSLL